MPKKSEETVLWPIHDLEKGKIVMKSFPRYTKSHPDKPEPMKKTTKKVSKVNHETVRKWKAANGTLWQIIKSKDKTGTSFFVRETSINGNILTHGRGLNTKQSAVKSFKAIIAGTIGLKEVKI